MSKSSYCITFVLLDLTAGQLVVRYGRNEF